jgi:hypothetical protein
MRSVAYTTHTAAVPDSRTFSSALSWPQEHDGAPYERCAGAGQRATGTWTGAGTATCHSINRPGYVSHSLSRQAEAPTHSIPHSAVQLQMT